MRAPGRSSQDDRLLVTGQVVRACHSARSALRASDTSKQSDDRNEATAKGDVLQVRCDVHLELGGQILVVDTEGLLDTSVDVLEPLADAVSNFAYLRVICSQAKCERDEEQQRDGGYSGGTHTDLDCSSESPGMEPSDVSPATVTVVVVEMTLPSLSFT